MNVSKTFEQFVENLKIPNKDEISKRYKNITKILNKKYWDSDSEINHSLQVGSYGRGTAIKGISDLDMVFELPWEVYSRFDEYENNGQSALLQEIKTTLLATYSSTNIKGDGQVVVISFNNYVIEVLPGFRNDDNSYEHPNSNDGGSWETTDPRAEISEINKANNDSQGNLKNLCKMVRSWKNKTGTPIGGFLIDTICYNFLKATPYYEDKGFVYYDWFSRDFFEYLSKQKKDQEYWLAPGSKAKVHKKGHFITKAKKAYRNCKKAIEQEKKKSANKIWKTVFGMPFPAAEKVAESVAKKEYSFRDTEEFIENIHNVDIRYSLSIDCTVTQAGFRTMLLSYLLSSNILLKTSKKLRLHVKYCNVPKPYVVKWKVRNVGIAAEKRDQIRGQIHIDCGQESRSETSSFRGGHFVECYIIKDNVCVARDKIDVPIT